MIFNINNMCKKRVELNFYSFFFVRKILIYGNGKYIFFLYEKIFFTFFLFFVLNVF